MPEGEVVLNTTQEQWDSIKGYAAEIDCPICNMDILVKTALIKKDSKEIIWALCHVCFEKGWEIPTLEDLDSEPVLIYENRKEVDQILFFPNPKS